jgi:hypothetical protein
MIFLTFCILMVLLYISINIEKMVNNQCVIEQKLNDLIYILKQK